MTENNQENIGVIQIRGKGTGFVTLPSHEVDVVIEREALGFALNGDTVAIELKKLIPGKRQEGKVIEVVEALPRTLIGVVKESTVGGNNHYYFSPDSRYMHIRPLLPGATPEDLGMKVVIEISEWKNATLDPIGTIIEVLGKAGDHETEMQAIMRGGGFSTNFLPPIQEAADKLHTDQGQIFSDAVADPKRKDFRGVLTMTIDPADAKDFDDALSIQTLPNGNLEVGIHIADVSHYVTEDSVLDKEARDRATSVYLVDRVIPMLPEVLSNDLCSLRPNEDRLAFSAVFELDNSGTVRSEWFGQTIIHSDKRFSYEEAQEVLDTNSGEYLTELTTLMTIGRKLRQKRFDNGAIAFEQPEVKFDLDEHGKPIRVYSKVRTETMMMIEDYMLLANMRVSMYVDTLAKKQSKNLLYIYRIHDLPNPDKIQELSMFVKVLGYELPNQDGVVTSDDLNALLAQVEGKPEEDLIKVSTIRSMAKAVYSTKNIGHFGLGFKHYSHFTSPIRRYPDLLAHRLLRKHLDSVNLKNNAQTVYENMAVHSSQREMEAVSAERDSIKFKQVEFMLDKVGQEFDAKISGVADFGMFVEIEEIRAEGLIPLAKMGDDFYEHLKSAYAIKGQRKGAVYRLGDKLRVKLTNADLEERRLDFELVK